MAYDVTATVLFDELKAEQGKRYKLQADYDALKAHADRFAALTPEVIDALLEAVNIAEDGEWDHADDPEWYARARAALESLKAERVRSVEVKQR